MTTTITLTDEQRLVLLDGLSAIQDPGMEMYHAHEGYGSDIETPEGYDALIESLRTALAWSPTHYSLNDGSVARLLSVDEVNETITLENEDGVVWLDDSFYWARIER